MFKRISMFLMGISALQAVSVEVNVSYDHYRGLPDGSWNGNDGAYAAANAGACLFDILGIQAGGSYGLYNWDGRQNLHFTNPKAIQQQAFITAGLFTSISHINAGLVYDRLFTHHFGIYDVSPSIDQLRFQAGYLFCTDELGLWGTSELTHKTTDVLGIPMKFKAVSQLNLFWTHYFANGAKTSLWAGAPYRKSLRFPRGSAFDFIAGASFRAPLMNSLFVEGHGSYVKARHGQGAFQSRNYAANLCFGLTYLFSTDCSESTYLPIADHSNFLVDTNFNQ